MQLIYFALVFLLSSCSLNLSDSHILFVLEERDIKSDTITEYRFFENGDINKSILHSSSSPEKLYTSSVYKSQNIEELKSFQKQLQKLDYHNEFPWKENFYEKGNIITIKFPGIIEEQKLEKTFYYYTGHEDSPELFKQIYSKLN